MTGELSYKTGMRISELVNRLLELQEELGDVCVTVDNKTVFSEVVGVSGLNLGDVDHPTWVAILGAV